MICRGGLNISKGAVALFGSRYKEGLKEEYHGVTYLPRDWEYAGTLAQVELEQSDVVLDIGGGCSYLAFFLSRFVQKVSVVDNGTFRISQSWFETLPDFEDYRSGKVEVLKQNAASLPFPDRYFDKVFTFSALEHFVGDDDTVCVKEVYRVLKLGGHFLGTVDYNAVAEFPVKDNIMVRTYTHESFLRRIVKPSGLAIKGKDFLENVPIPESVKYIVAPLFFHLVKKENGY